ncbi:MAG TPA: ABC transporter permease subunit [Candidatus Dormibacteraeota bacterium]|nr:ABC transporter permease subunit [Candidatus Dormibacteraeota bacterium]
MASARDIASAVPGGSGRATAVISRRARGRVRRDRLATAVVRAGGLGIVASIMAILVFIVAEVVPMLGGADVTLSRVDPLPGATVGAVIADEFGTHVAALDAGGTVRVLRVADGQVVAEQALADGSGGLAASQVPPGTNLLTGATADGRVLLMPVRWDISFAGQQRVVTPSLGERQALEVDPTRHPVPVYTAGLGDTGAAAAGQIADGALVVVRETRQENQFTGEVVEAQERFTAAVPGHLTQLVFDRQQRNLFGADTAGNLIWWPLSAAGIGAPQIVPAGTTVTALTLLLGGRSLVVGQADGALSVWFVAPRDDGSQRLTRVRDFPRRAAPIVAIAPSQRDKGFLATDARGGLGLYYSTSNRVMWSGTAPFPASALAFGPRGNGAYLAGDGRLAAFAVDNPHPEVSFDALFGRVWYEGYAKPDFVWQSSSGSDDFEPKLSLTPLLFGTLKGTVYSLLIAIPLAVFGAMYLSQFMHPRLKTVVKPAVEIMAALPSVVLGFLAGLWLAPHVQRLFPALLVMTVLFPLLSVAAGLLWSALPRRWRGRLPAGSEVAIFLVVLAAGLWASVAISPAIERIAFGGNFQAWLLDTTGLTYDQRNAIIVGLAMGFAVIPIIFAIAEDAFSNVPRDIVSGSLALGANRWQTVTRIVLPTASPGIFSAIMVGFGRAVGETMIVLMATGNTPILDWSPFNGFRTLSANIAVEVPEAPVNGTLFRVLFLAALLLFVVTFLVNTAAELVRQRLRRRYSQL